MKNLILILLFFPLAHEAVAQVFWDPHEYCRAVGKSNNPEKDARYKGPKATEKMASVFDGKLSDFAIETGGRNIEYTLVWRCANSQVFACIEPNAPQCGKADTSRKPTAEMKDWCRNNPNTSIPAAVSGHMTVYDWNCVGRKATVGRQFMQVDSEGYAIDMWKRISR